MDLELKDRVAIVTGGGMGIGKDVARPFISRRLQSRDLRASYELFGGNSQRDFC